MSRFTPRYNKKVTMVSCLLKRKTYISVVEGLKCRVHRSKGAEVYCSKTETYFLKR